MLLAFCNPLIDVSVQVDEAFLKKWGLKNDDAILADSFFQPLIDETVRKEKAIITAGGGCQNALVMYQWMVQKDGETIIVGSVGDDENRKILEETLLKCGVKHHYQIIPNMCTGCCAILLCNNNRSIVASLGASGAMEYNYWETPEVINSLKKANVVMISTFFIRSSDKIALSIALECHRRKIPLVLCLSSPSAIESVQFPTFYEIFKKATIIFGNETEIISFAKKFKILSSEKEDVNIMELTKKIANFETPCDKRIVVTTMGSQPTIGCQNGNEPINRSTIKIENSKIIDTNGAGDSFAGGFLAYYVKGCSLETCIDAGNYCASCNIQVRGCTVPNYKPDFKIQ
ncbi:adenosine kinase 2 [Histomonas meleagridis]|uniref:adenosine kinase 2 n=1 Tax=Histomonas meleagridis TaxID=135588 RepID=UPI00355A488A|nr:adenosine kinase 2 [Histomonas meleagridis]KAH0806308.1 adenosine kinase 2 [Histomonas meleagridis]